MLTAPDLGIHADRDHGTNRIPFALAYLLTDDLGLPAGVHFGCVLIEFLNGLTVGEFEVTDLIAITQNTPLANLEPKLLRIGLTCLCLLLWVYLIRSEIRMAETIRHRNGEESPTR
ncbi:hypothetical protein [Halalkalicoccus salilacus]|uniref:hypothetical protein n=1 Tax=Halalkalicoccus salilacus TaxID=3117459 RepID=UPI00300F3A3E